jgi:hypothetical protein
MVKNNSEVNACDMKFVDASVSKQWIKQVLLKILIRQHYYSFQILTVTSELERRSRKSLTLSCSSTNTPKQKKSPLVINLAVEMSCKAKFL